MVAGSGGVPANAETMTCSQTLEAYPMERPSRRSLLDSKESETAARFLEDLAVHADNDEERQRCLAVAKNLRSAARRHDPQIEAAENKNQA
jgi:hypothetical protein